MEFRFWMLLICCFWDVAKSTQDINIVSSDCPKIQLNNHLAVFSIKLSKPVRRNVNVHLYSTNPRVASNIQENFTLSGEAPVLVYVYAYSIGEAHIKIKVNDTRINQKSVEDGVHIQVIHSQILEVMAAVLGWIYFLCWTVSIYPQMYENFARRSVVGLNFDYLAYNLTGYFAYSIFNIGLFYSTSVQDEYFKKYGGDEIPVRANDVFMAVHMMIANVVIIIQACFFERGDQKVTRLCKVLVGVACLFGAVAMIPVLIHKMTWLTYLNFFSYVKLVFVIIKSAPQFYMNYRRKSTVGWSIGGVLADLIGALFSLLQMFFLAYNNNEWSSIFGDFSKFGLGVLSLLIDFIYMLQHYVFYRTDNYKRLENTDQTINISNA